MKKEDPNSSKAITWFIIVFLSLGLIYFIFLPKAVELPQSSVDIFAECLAENGAKMYGANWCSHCQAQKKLFRNSTYMPYVECATADGTGQLAVCATANIKAYPTWRFADGVEKTGELSFAELAELTGCEAPK